MEQIPKFLIVDDDQEILKIAEAMITSLGCQCETAQSGEEALRLLHSEKRSAEFDAVFLDVMMPSLSGLAVLKELKSKPETAEMPVVMLTALDGRKDIIEGYSLGADYYIPKPFTQDQIVFGLNLLFGDGESETQEIGERKAKVHFVDFDPDA